MIRIIFVAQYLCVNLSVILYGALYSGGYFYFTDHFQWWYIASTIILVVASILTTNDNYPYNIVNTSNKNNIISIGIIAFGLVSCFGLISVTDMFILNIICLVGLFCSYKFISKTVQVFNDANNLTIYRLFINTMLFTSVIFTFIDSLFRNPIGFMMMDLFFFLLTVIDSVIVLISVYTDKNPQIDNTNVDLDKIKLMFAMGKLFIIYLMFQIEWNSDNPALCIFIGIVLVIFSSASGSNLDDDLARAGYHIKNCKFINPSDDDTVKEEVTE